MLLVIFERWWIAYRQWRSWSEYHWHGCRCRCGTRETRNIYQDVDGRWSSGPWWQVSNVHYCSAVLVNLFHYVWNQMLFNFTLFSTAMSMSTKYHYVITYIAVFCFLFHKWQHIAMILFDAGNFLPVLFQFLGCVKNFLFWV